MEDFILKLARETIETYVKTGRRISIPENYPEKLNEKRGIFVTIYRKDSKELRGCVGLPYPQISLIEGLIQAAISACEDPRFEPLSQEELDKIIIEVSILTEPELIDVKNPREYIEKIEIGKHGLIIKKGFNSGLLLPKVPVELNWDINDYLENLCLKADMTTDSWMDSYSKIYKFEAEVFRESD